MNWIQLTGALEMGLIYGVVAIAVYLTFRVIDFPDLTVDGSFTLGGAVAAALLMQGSSPWLATVAAGLAGALAGSVTGFLHVKGRILGLLAGILTMTGLYSVNLRVMGRSNVSFLGEETLFSTLEQTSSKIPFIGLLAAVVTLLLGLFLLSEIGLGLRATGINPRVSQAYGVRVQRMIVLGLTLSNALVGFAGAVFAQYVGFSDMANGQGTIIVGLASVIIGEAIVRSRHMIWGLVGCLVGAVTYRIAISMALHASDLGLKSGDMNLVTALLVAVALLVPKIKKQRKAELS